MDTILKKQLVSQKFGVRNRVEKYSKGINRGTDFAVKTGTPVAIPEGNWKVVETFNKASASGPNNRQRGANKGYGNSVVVKNLDTGEKMRFSHLSRVGVKPGETVSSGKVVGLTGATGNVAGKTGQHLDVEYFDSKGTLKDVLSSRYADKPIIAAADEGVNTSVSGYATTNTGSTDKNMDTEWQKEKAKAIRFAQSKGWNAKRTAEFVDWAGNRYEIKTGKKKAEDVEDISDRIEARETQEGMDISTEGLFEKDPVKKLLFGELKKDATSGVTSKDLYSKYGVDFGVPLVEKVYEDANVYGQETLSEFAKNELAKGTIRDIKPDETMASYKQEIKDAGSREEALSLLEKAKAVLEKENVNITELYKQVEESHPEGGDWFKKTAKKAVNKFVEYQTEKNKVFGGLIGIK